MNTPTECEALISVIVPVYKVEAYLNRCVDSILGQTYPNLEVILVDDGSPDRSGEICDDYAKEDPRVKVIHKENAGLGMARNTGIEYATGECVCFVDSDDYIVQEAVEKAYRAMKESNVELVHFGFQSIDAKGCCTAKIIPETTKAVYRNEEIMDYLLPNLIGYDLRTGIYTNLEMSACMTMFSGPLIRKAHWRFVSEREILSEDIYSLLDLYGFVTSAMVLKEALYCYCENGSSLSRVYREDRYQRTKVFFEESVKLCHRKGYPQIVANQMRVPFLRSVSAAMKQITRAQLPLGKKLAFMQEIMEDAVFLDVLATLDMQHETKARKLFFKAILERRFLLAYCLIALKAKR